VFEFTGVSGNEPFGSRPEPGTCLIAPILPYHPARSRRAGPVVFRILPQEFRAKARTEGPRSYERAGPT
jgi:hypothetical protein